MTPMPPRIAKLPRDKRGYPIPWNVLRDIDDKPVFIVNDQLRQLRAFVDKLCPTCGEPLGRWKWFVGGPGSAFDPNGWYLDLPMHWECTEYALRVCPFLAAPQFLHRLEIINFERLQPEHRILIDETVTPERPVLFVAAAGSKIETQPLRATLLPYVRPERPALAYTFWRQGKQLLEVEALPILRERFGADWRVPKVSGD